jgi:hypothetical protein
MQTTRCELENVGASVHRLALCRRCGEIIASRRFGLLGFCARCIVAAASTLLELAAVLEEPEAYLCFENASAVAVVPLTRERTRIGPSLTAEARFEDATVSRRHALIVRGPDELRLLDDGSLNEVFLDGKRTQSGRLTHGDEIRVGRHRLPCGAFDPLDKPAGIAPSARAMAVRDAVPA